MTAVTEEIQLQIDRRVAILREAYAAGEEEHVATLLAQIADLHDLRDRIAAATDIRWSPHDIR